MTVSTLDMLNESISQGIPTWHAFIFLAPILVY